MRKTEGRKKRHFGVIRQHSLNKGERTPQQDPFGLERREGGVSTLKAENLMMTMTTMADGLEAQDSSKSAFMEFGQQSHSQQSSPSMAASHYPLHCLHSSSHAHQHDNSPYSGSNSYNRSLPYSYMSHPHHSPYLPSYHNNATGTQTRLDTGKRTFTFLHSLTRFQCIIRLFLRYYSLRDYRLVLPGCLQNKSVYTLCELYSK